MAEPASDGAHARNGDTLPARLAAIASERPEGIALREKSLGIWRELTWLEYLDGVRAAAASLWALGVRPGDHVAILSDNRTEWLFADLGAQAVGARAVGVYQTNPPDDVAYVLRHSGSSVVFCEDQEQVDKAVEIAADTPAVRHVVVFDPRGTRDYDDPRLMDWERFLAAAAPDEAWFRERLAALDPDEPSMVVYTSGTTGDPKGALITPASVLAAARSMQPTLGLCAQDTVLSYLPLCHVAEKIFTFFIPLTIGACVHFGESIETIQSDLREVSPTLFLGVPRIWEKMHATVTLKMRDASWLQRGLFAFWSAKGRAIAERRLAHRLGALDRLLWRIGDLLVFRAVQERLGMRRCRLPISGAAPISKELLAWFHGIGIPIAEAYGMTECGGASHVNPPGAVRLGTVGPAIDGLDVRLANDGEVLMHGPLVFCGYLHDEAASAQAVDGDGWLHTGDLGALDADGYLSITGRKKEILITAGGKNLSPEKIENAMKASRFVKEAVAIGDARPFVSVLIQIEPDAVGDWAARRKLPYTSFEDLSSKEEVRALIAVEVGEANEALARVEQVREFRLLTKELHQDDGELTATQKVRRREVARIHGALIESMYTKEARR
ncbi:MAG: AMP-binding protein [Planctomycetota bacterium]|jgi:long-chain acyl-CoA synthetase|nr:AMP-binding protein [Planctomycetota bacterium]MDP6764082.1 AMP-binding protein [Planctomycetota bacterium]MDP6989798.1 AMP-binding protein [Planctomycetota bacterium]